MSALTSTINWKDQAELFREAVFNSYSMVFFSLNRWFAIVVLVLSFLDPVAGLAGFFSVLLVNAMAIGLGFNRVMIHHGDLGFNALLVGLGLGAYYELNLPLVLLLFFAGIITLFVTIALLGILSKYQLPFLSLPFVVALWTVMLAARNFEALGVSQRGIYLLNELYAVGDNMLVDIYQYLNSLPLAVGIKTYFRSLGAILFQYNLLTGLVLSIALLFYSRQAFTLSIIGFFSAYGFYQFIGADLSQLNYNYIGFNFILSAIAIGGIFLVASGWSYFWVLLLVPVLSILTSSLANLLADLQLGVYSLPFNVVVLSFLYLLKWRTVKRAPEEVAVQTFSPEHNRYNALSNRERFRHYRAFAISLPVMGEWFVEQGRDDEITHRGEWRHAWDFIVVDEKGKAFLGEGRRPEDYYCYGKPVIAPAAGTIVEVVEHVADNDIGESNLQQNWGNSIVIDHGYALYSQLSHLRPGSFKVKKGDYVKKGQVLAQCGNSGRSPEPHLHFQLQATPYVGAQTIEYPIALFLCRSAGANKNERTDFRFFDFPGKKCYVQNVQPLDLVKYAFYFIPGKKMTFSINGQRQVQWECRTDIYNNSYIECLETGAKAYFRNQDGYLHYFTSYQGPRGSLLYHFVLAHYQVVLGYHPGLIIEDRIPLHLVMPARHPLRWLQDILTPFVQFIQTRYRLRYTSLDGPVTPREIYLEASVYQQTVGAGTELYRYRTVLRDYRPDRFEIDAAGKKTIATWVAEPSS